MKGSLNEWQTRLQPILEAQGAELLEAQVSRRRHSYAFRFFVDREEGIGVDDLALLSRRIGLLLDGDPVLAGNYSLEVSSPGMNRVVRTEAHFRRFVGERVHLWTHRPKEGRTHFEGTICGCEQGVVRIAVGKLGEIPFDLAEIRRAELRLDPRRPPKKAPPIGEARNDEAVSDDQ
jgi:ribosome maturation factor RimP